MRFYVSKIDQYLSYNVKCPICPYLYYVHILPVFEKNANGLLNSEIM